MDTGSFINRKKSEDFYKDIADDVEKRYDTSNYELDRPLPKGMNERVIGWMNVALRPKTYSYLPDHDKNVKKAIWTKKCVIKRIHKFNDYNDCLFKNEIILKSQQRFKMRDIVYILKKSIRLH